MVMAFEYVKHGQKSEFLSLLLLSAMRIRVNHSNKTNKTNNDNHWKSVVWINYENKLIIFVNYFTVSRQTIFFLSTFETHTKKKRFMD